MIISRAPFRVSFCGGGSDIPSFYEKYGGCVISTSIRKYVYLSIHKAFNADTITVKYSQTESVTDPSMLQHKIFRQAFLDTGIKGVEVTSMADIPAGTGLGSSSSFTVALLKLLYTYSEKTASTYKIAKEACDIEINQLGNPIGKQDQFAAAYGGLRFYEFFPDGFVKVEPVVMRHDTYSKLENNLLMFYTGTTHSASAILSAESKSLGSDERKIEATKHLCQMARDLRKSFEENDIDELGPTLKESWEIKKSLASGISNPLIDEMYEKAISGGATGAKLLGAGGAGFLLAYCPTPDSRASVRSALSGYKEMPFELDQSGVSIIFMD